MRKIILSLLFIISANLSAQIDTTRKEFYPLQVGNLWQYRNFGNSLVTSIIGKDTLLEGNQYFLYERVALRSQLGIGIRIDSLMRVQHRRGNPTAGDSCGGNTPYESSIYRLDEPDSTFWEICEAFTGHLGSQLVRFNKTFIAPVFGELREVMEFNYGGKVPNEDTVWGYGALLARGIGVLQELYFDGDYVILEGAIINGVQYGNIVAVDEIAETIPEEIILYHNYPNPFNPITKIRYDVSVTTDVKLKVFNVIGEEIANLVDEIKYPGRYEVEFDASGLSSSVYIYRLTAVGKNKTFSQSKQMILLK